MCLWPQPRWCLYISPSSGICPLCSNSLHVFLAPRPAGATSCYREDWCATRPVQVRSLCFWRPILLVPLAVTLKTSALPPFFSSKACIRFWRRCPAAAASPKKTGAQSHCAFGASLCSIRLRQHDMLLPLDWGLTPGDCNTCCCAHSRAAVKLGWHVHCVHERLAL